MIKRIFVSFLLSLSLSALYAQLPKVYNEDINPLTQIDEALKKAQSADHFVICQVGGNWCSWCLRFADFIQKDTTISKVISDNFEYIHVNYPRRGAAKDLMQRLNNPGRFGYPVFVVLDAKGQVLHIQDSSFLEEGEGYDPKKVLRFFNAWTPQAVKGEE